MVKVFSPMRGQDPLAATLNSLGKSMFGDQLSAAINQEKLYGAQRENVEMDNLMKRTVQGGGAQVLGNDPLAQAMMIGSGYDPAQFGKMGLMGAATGFGAADPRTQAWQVGTGQSYDNTAGAFNQKLGETARNNDMQSADRRYGVDQNIGQQRFEFGNIGADQAVDNAEAMRNNDIQSADRRYGVDQTVGQQRDEFMQKPMPALGPDGQPTFAPQGGLVNGPYAPVLSETDQKGTLLGANFGNLPALNPQQQEVLGARVAPGGGGTPFNYRAPTGQTFMTVDGVTDAQTGQPLPKGGARIGIEDTAQGAGLTNAVTTDVQSKIMSADRFLSLADRMVAMTEKNKSAFGAVGAVRSMGQELWQGVSSVQELFGGDAGTVAVEARKELNANGLGALVPELYDPDLPTVATLGGLLVYSGASALAGQENRSVSDKDVVAMREIIGDPRGWNESAMSIGVKVKLAADIVKEHRQLAQEYLLKGLPVPQDGSLVTQASVNVMARGGAGSPVPPQAAPALQAPAATQGAPQPGVVEDGFEFLGGDPANPQSWRQVQ